MHENSIRVAVSGSTGQMGLRLIQFLLSSNIYYQSVILTGAVSRYDSKFIGCDIGTLVSNKSVGIVISDSIESIHGDFDILIDFSHSQGTLKYLDICKKYKKNMVIGTTGFTKQELLIIQSASNHIGIVLSPNFSVMVNLMLRLLQKSATVLNNCLDIRIFEIHHRHKSDVPSGTALRMREVMLSSLLNSNGENEKLRSRPQKGTEQNIEISAMRAGDTVGEHSVFFVDSGERLEFIHRAFDREIFVNGAIRSAVWLGKRKVGLFDMIDVLGIGDF